MLSGAYDSCHAIILTALDVEYRAVRAHLVQHREIVHREGTVYELGNFSTQGGVWKIALAQVGKGNVSAAFEAERAIEHFSPKFALFVGVAGGLKDVCVGDVVAATKVYGYEAGKVGKDFAARPEVGSSAYSMEQRARAEAKKEDWLWRIKGQPSTQAPQVFVAPIAAGEKVINSTRSSVCQFLKAYYSDALAVEMEGHGFLSATHARGTIQALIIRGISNLLDDKGEADAASFQAIAARHASAFAFEILAKLGAHESPLTPTKETDAIVGTGLAPVREMVAHARRTDRHVPPTCGSDRGQPCPHGGNAPGGNDKSPGPTMVGLANGGEYQSLPNPNPVSLNESMISNYGAIQGPCQIGSNNTLYHVIHQAPVKDNAVEGRDQLQKGRDALYNGYYVTARQHLEQAACLLSADLFPLENAQVKYVQALTDLHGKRPFGVTLHVIHHVEELMQMAIDLSSAWSYLYTFALFKRDFARNGWFQARYVQEAEQLIQRSRCVPSVPIDKSNMALLSRCQPQLLRAAQEWGYNLF